MSNSGGVQKLRPGARGVRLAMAAGAVVGLAIASRLTTRRRLPSAGPWERALAATRGKQEAARLMAAAQARYDRLCADVPRPASRALRVHLYQFIVPGLAMYQTLLEGGDDRESALAEMERLHGMRIRPRLWLVDVLRFFPDPLLVFRRATWSVMRVGFPPQGWTVEAAEATPDSFGFDIRRCFYLDTLTALGAPELTGIYCRGDDVLFAALPPSIGWQRTMTLAGGHDRCDFRWQRR